MASRGDDGSWSRAYMASSGLTLAGRARSETAELHLAASADLSRQRIASLSQHKDPAVREAIARRADCPFGVLAALAHDSRPLVRIAVAAHPRAGRTVLEHLARDRDPHVVKAVARNAAAPLDLVQALLSHRREEVRHLARRMCDERAAAPLAEQEAAPASMFAPVDQRAVSLHREAPPSPAPAETYPVRKVAPRTLAPRPSVGRDADTRRPWSSSHAHGLDDVTADTMWPTPT